MPIQLDDVGGHIKDRPEGGLGCIRKTSPPFLVRELKPDGAVSSPETEVARYLPMGGEYIQYVGTYSHG